MWEIVLAGGPFMWPIILCSVIAGAIVLERLWTLQQQRVMRRSSRAASGHWSRLGRVSEKVITALEANSPLGKLLATGLANRHRPRQVLMERIEDTGRHVAHDLDRFLNTLGTIAGVAPLLGPARHGHRHHPRLQCHP